jgi:hypothetical protein
MITSEKQAEGFGKSRTAIIKPFLAGTFRL